MSVANTEMLGCTYQATLAPTPAHISYEGADDPTKGHIGFDVAITPPIPPELRAAFLYALSQVIKNRLIESQRSGKNLDAREALSGLYIGPPDDGQWETTADDNPSPLTLIPVSGDVPRRMIPGHQLQSPRPAGWLPPYVTRLVQAALVEIDKLEQD